MKKILTIDFDIIMGPSIPFYDHISPCQGWESLMQIPQIALSYADYGIYATLTQDLMTILKKVPNKDNIHFVGSQDQAMDYIPFDEKIDIINIDHHHDLNYPNQEGKLQEERTCMNWVEKLNASERLARYTWIHNNSSEPVAHDQVPYNEIDLARVGNLVDYVGTPDYVVISLSPEWIPPHIVPLFNVWILMAREACGVDFQFIEPINENNRVCNTCR